MTPEDVRKKMQEGFDLVRPKVVDMTAILMDVYEAGFACCFELLTGQKFGKMEQ
jgi:hypothetical protein